MCSAHRPVVMFFEKFIYSVAQPSHFIFSDVSQTHCVEFIDGNICSCCSKIVQLHYKLTPNTDTRFNSQIEHRLKASGCIKGRFDHSVLGEGKLVKCEPTKQLDEGKDKVEFVLQLLWCFCSCSSRTCEQSIDTNEGELLTGSVRAKCHNVPGASASSVEGVGSLFFFLGLCGGGRCDRGLGVLCVVCRGAWKVRGSTHSQGKRVCSHNLGCKQMHFVDELFFDHWLILDVLSVPSNQVVDK